MKILITGGAGFIGSHLAKKILVSTEYEVVAIDNLNDYYDVNLKKDRIDLLNHYNNFRFEILDICDKNNMNKLFSKESFDIVINLAAQAGVRYSLENPEAYIKSNIEGFLNILNLSKDYSIKHLLYASSSSVYGGNTKLPLSTTDNVDHPVSIYAATKKSNELMAHAYSHLYNLPTTGLRFFTVYGPWGRPDMAYFSFTKNILEGKPINVYNNGHMQRDFTYIDDIVESLFKLINHIPNRDNIKKEEYSANESWAPYKIYNIGNSEPVNLMDFINTIENKLSTKARINFEEMQAGDVKDTYADTHDLENDINFKPNTSIERGLSEFIDWYIKYYK
ncbi:NAD-dependent epimerase/dehydratase family protein [Enterococcus casseliflavus]|nr:NAD-dependent epimerase/dehydratase family protein [Enterococcus innesii]MBW9324174.1 NAD-dependent epimerase/dehydratase family protein [Enterococcus casseliflavus]MEB5951041.1 GDP-mannose 4,6-dehydratase [Enterococcus innesii]